MKAHNEDTDPPDKDFCKTSFSLDLLGLPSFAVSRDGKILAWNKKLAMLSQLSEYEALQYLLPDILQSDEDRLQWHSALGQCLEENEPQKCALHMKFCPDRSPLSITIASYSTKENNPMDFAVCFVDSYAEMSTVHGYKEKESIGLANSDYCRIIERSCIATIGVDTNFSIFLWNEKMEDLSGFSKSDVMGKQILDYAISTHLPFEESCRRAFAGETPSNCFFELRTKCKQVKYIRAIVTPYMDDNSAIRGAMVVADFCTNDEPVSLPVSHPTEGLRQFIDAAPILIFGVDRNGLVNEWNKATAETTAFASQCALNKPLIETFVREDERDSMHVVQKEALLGKVRTNYELEMITHCGESRHLLVTAAARRCSDTLVCGVIYIAHDITEALKQDRAVEAMANELRQLIDNANAPIFGINCDGYVLLSQKGLYRLFCGLNKLLIIVKSMNGTKRQRKLRDIRRRRCLAVRLSIHLSQRVYKAQ